MGVTSCILVFIVIFPAKSTEKLPGFHENEKSIRWSTVSHHSKFMFYFSHFCNKSFRIHKSLKVQLKC